MLLECYLKPQRHAKSIHSLVLTMQVLLVNEIQKDSRYNRTPPHPLSLPNTTDLDPKMDAHAAAVFTLSTAIKSFHAAQTPFRIYHGSTNSTRITNFNRNAIIDTSPLSHVLSISPTNLTATVQSNVPMDALLRATLKHALLPPVVIEFPGITIGGAFAGTAGESSSFIHGFFDACVNWVELILGNGEVVRASLSENPDLFEGAKGSFGTLGVATLFEIRLARTSGWVDVEFLPVKGVGEALALLRQCSGEGYDYLEGIQFSAEHGVVIAGRHALDGQRPKHRVQRLTRAHDPWFYLVAQKQTRNTTFSVPITDYLFRYDRGAFWTGSYSFGGLLPFNRLTRFLLNPLMKTRKIYQGMHHSGNSQRFIVQDLGIPERNTKAFIEWVDQKFGIWPLWLCPLRGDAKANMQRMPQSQKEEEKGIPLRNGQLWVAKAEAVPDLVINVGVWGPGHGYGATDADFARFVADNRELEGKVLELGGLKWLYAHSYYTEEEFWSIYDRKEYDSLRAKYHAVTLPTVYAKIKSVEERQNGSELKGVLGAIFGREHLLAKKNKGAQSRKKRLQKGD